MLVVSTMAKKDKLKKNWIKEKELAKTIFNMLFWMKTLTCAMLVTLIDARCSPAVYSVVGWRGKDVENLAIQPYSQFTPLTQETNYGYVYPNNGFELEQGKNGIMILKTGSYQVDFSVILYNSEQEQACVYVAVLNVNDDAVGEKSLNIVSSTNTVQFRNVVQFQGSGIFSDLQAKDFVSLAISQQCEQEQSISVVAWSIQLTKIE
jgi:hypothetical protein